MSIRHPDELRKVLSDPKKMGRVFSRHAYGMNAWVELFTEKAKSVEDPEIQKLMIEVAKDNKKHAKLFSDRAKELGETPETYKPPEIGQKIYDILEQYDDVFDDFAYAWGSLIHFSELLSLYHSVADDKSKTIIEQVEDDVIRHLSSLEQYFSKNADTQEKKERAREVIAVADNIYADREEEEIKWYAS